MPVKRQAKEEKMRPDEIERAIDTGSHPSEELLYSITMLLGKEGVEYVFWKFDPFCWKVRLWMRRN